MQCLRGLRFKKHYFPHTIHYCCSPLPCLSKTHWFLQSSLFWKAQCDLIGQLSIALWLAEYLNHVTEMLRPLPYMETHSVSTTWRWRQQYYSENKSYTFFLCINIWAVLCKSSNIVILSMHKQLVTLKRQRKTWNRIIWPL